MKRSFIATAAAAALLVVGSSLLHAQPEQKDLRVLGAPHAERPAKPVTFLGVETRPVGATLTEQLGLPNGVGLVVQNIVPDSPAAGILKQHDILTKLNDQVLIETRQLAVLVRGYKEGDEITLTYVRGGKEATAKVKLTKRELPQAFFRTFPHPINQRFFRGRMVPGEGDQLLRNLAPAAGERGQSIRIIRKGSTGVAEATAVAPENSQLMFSDDEGSFAVSMKDGVKNLVAKNAKGETIFDGPVSTPEQIEALPKPVRERFEQMEKLDTVSFTEVPHLSVSTHFDGDSEDSVFPPSNPI
ncbi:hypothetical protein DB347_14295 [Opitutaceae bacterium EW11]|nr:hypothetical protein DB347_14295 [Opitutaceae bacterium EW11]